MALDPSRKLFTSSSQVELYQVRGSVSQARPGAAFPPTQRRVGVLWVGKFPASMQPE
jgi:hypothetical protein